MQNVTYGLFFDNHTHIENPDVGKNFDAEVFTDNLKKCKVNFLGFHARCNAGLAYYDTKIGIKHPALTYDLFGEVTRCCRKKDIAVIAYLNGGISTQEGLAHRDWTTVYKPGKGSFWRVSPYAITMCYNSPWRDHLIAMVREIVSNYPVEGVFIDCLAPYTCVCPNCIKMMQEAKVDYNDDNAVLEFSRQSVVRLCQDITKAVKEIKNDPMLFFNGPLFDTVKDCDTYFDFECLPTAGWGYECLPEMAHAIRNIDESKQVLNMTGRFYNWGDFGGLRTAPSLLFDLQYGLAHGMRPNVGGHVHPRGDRDQAVFDRIAQVYGELQKYEDWYTNAKNVADIAVIYPQQDKNFQSKTMRSCVRMLDELKMQFDIIFSDCKKSWANYKLLILPENVEINDVMIEKINAHIANNGKLIAFGKVAAEKLGAQLGIQYVGDSLLDPVYFQMNGEYNDKLEDMYLSLYAPACHAKLAGATGASRLVKPYYNYGWNGVSAMFYAPPQEETEMPFITRKGDCIWCAGDLFTGYSTRGAIHLRDIFKNLIFTLLEEPLVKVEKMPSYSRVILTEQPGRINAHIIVYAPEKRSDCTVVEEAAAIVNGKFSIYTGGRKVKAAYYAPTGEPVDVETDGNYTTVKLPAVEGFALISLDVE